MNVVKYFAVVVFFPIIGLILASVWGAQAGAHESWISLCNFIAGGVFFGSTISLAYSRFGYRRFYKDDSNNNHHALLLSGTNNLLAGIILMCVGVFLELDSRDTETWESAVARLESTWDGEDGKVSEYSYLGNHRARKSGAGKVGSTTTIYYDPMNPERHTFTKGRFNGIFILFLCIGLWLAYTGTFKLRKATKARSNMKSPKLPQGNLTDAQRAALKAENKKGN